MEICQELFECSFVKKGSEVNMCLKEESVWKISWWVGKNVTGHVNQWDYFPRAIALF